MVLTKTQTKKQEQLEELVIVKDSYMIIAEDEKVFIDFEPFAVLNEDLKNEIIEDYKSLGVNLFPTFINLENLNNVYHNAFKGFFQTLEAISFVGTALISNDEKSEIIARVAKGAYTRKLPCNHFRSITEATIWANQIKLFKNN